ncbi:MAG: hypothetical protein ABIP55_06145 [Tepidisphaeraceae bacterium]
MRRIATILLIGTFVALGAGVLEHAHYLQHVHDDALAAADSSDSSHQEGKDGSHGDPADCLLHGLLHAPLLSAGWAPLLVCLGTFVAFLTLLAERPAAVRLLARLDCRGPPALA